MWSFHPSVNLCNQKEFLHILVSSGIGWICQLIIWLASFLVNEGKSWHSFFLQKNIFYLYACRKFGAYKNTIFREERFCKLWIFFGKFLSKPSNTDVAAEANIWAKTLRLNLQICCYSSISTIPRSCETNEQNDFCFIPNQNKQQIQ